MIARTLSEIARDQRLIAWMTCSSLVIFLVFFIGVFFWTSRRNHQSHYRIMSKMPLEKEMYE
ncbi:hypothetical protein K2X30_07615 [bacterium]|nr:hypothetical protein [bacterium]